MQVTCIVPSESIREHHWLRRVLCVCGPAGPGGGCPRSSNDLKEAQERSESHSKFDSGCTGLDSTRPELASSKVGRLTTQDGDGATRTPDDPSCGDPRNAGEPRKLESKPHNCSSQVPALSYAPSSIASCAPIPAPQLAELHWDAAAEFLYAGQQCKLRSALGTHERRARNKAAEGPPWTSRFRRGGADEEIARETADWK